MTSIPINPFPNSSYTTLTTQHNIKQTNHKSNTKPETKQLGPLQFPKDPIQVLT